MAIFCRSDLLLSFCKNGFRLLRFVKKLNSTKRGTLFRYYCVSKVITTAHEHKSGVIFHIFPRLFKQKKLRSCMWPKMTKIPSRGSCLDQYLKNGPKMFRAGFTGDSPWLKTIFPLFQSGGFPTFSWDVGFWKWRKMNLMVKTALFSQNDTVFWAQSWFRVLFNIWEVFCSELFRKS